MSDSQKLAKLSERIADLEHELESHKSRLSQFRQLVDSIAEAFWIASPESHDDVSFVSLGYEAIWGRSCQSLYDGTDTWEQGIHPEDRERIRQEFVDKAVKGKFNVEYRMVRQDGAVHWIHDRGFPVRNSAGVVDRIVGIATDITQHKLAEHERDRFFELSLDFLCTATMDGFFKQINPVFSKRLGYSDEELLGRPFLEFVHPDDRASTLEAMQSLSEGDDVVRFANRYLCKDGSYRWLAWSTPAPRPGEPLLYAVARDITEEKAAQQAVVESEARYRELFENANDLIMTVDLDGIFTALNKAGEELTGYWRADLIGADLSMLMSAGQATKMRWVNQHMIATRQPARYELDITSKEGKRIPVDINARLIYENNQPVAVQAIARDITERKLYERHLTAAKDAAEAASQAKSEFLANMSHEIRTPMNAVIGMTELLLDSQLDRDQREYLETVLASADALMSIINEVLDFSKVESGRLELVLEPFDLRECVGDTLRTLTLRAHKKGLELALRVAPEIPQTLVGDASRVRQLIVNLVGNAIKFSAEGKVAINVVRAAQIEEGIQLQFSVSDTGIGIPEDKLEVVFEAFEQVDSSSTRQFGGTGLGLAISQRVVEAMGGRIWAESQLGQGSTFHFTADFEIGVQPVAAEGDAGTTAENGPTRPLRILLAEDGLANQKLAVGLLQRWGHQAVVANNGREAIEQYQSQPFDLILMDVQMPEIDGLDATRRIREIERQSGAHIPIVAMTAHAMAGDREKCHASGMDGYVAKPIRKQTLYEALAPYLVVEAYRSMPRDDKRDDLMPGFQAALADLPVLDWRGALAQVDGDRDLLVIVSAAALEEIPARLENLRTALDGDDREVIKRESHTIKGALRVFGPTKVGSIAAQIEATNGVSPEVRGLFTALEQEVGRLLPVLDACEQHI